MKDIAETAQIFLDQLRKSVFDIELLEKEKYDHTTKEKIINNAYFWETLRFLGIEEVDFKKRLNRPKSPIFEIYVDILENKIKNKWIESVLPIPVSKIDVICYHKARFYYELLQDKKKIEELRTLLERSKSKDIEDMLKNTDKNLIFKIAFCKEMLLGQEIENIKSNQGVLYFEEFEILSKPGVIKHQTYNNNIAHRRLENIELNKDKDKKNKKYVFGPLGILPLSSKVKKIKLKNDMLFSEKLISVGLINKRNMKKILDEFKRNIERNFNLKDIFYYQNTIYHQKKIEKIDSIYKLNQYLLTVDDDILIDILNHLLKEKEISFRFEFHDINEKSRIIISDYGIVKTQTFFEPTPKMPLIFSPDERDLFNIINNYCCFINKYFREDREQILKDYLKDKDLYNLITENPLFFYEDIASHEFKKMLDCLGFFNMKNAKENDLLLLKSMFLTYFHFIPSFDSSEKSDLYRLNNLVEKAKHNAKYNLENTSNIKNILKLFEKIMKNMYSLFFHPFYQQISIQFEGGDGTFKMIDICYESICDYYKHDYEKYRYSDNYSTIASQFEELFKKELLNKSKILKNNIETKDISDDTWDIFKNNSETNDNITKESILELYKNNIKPIILKKVESEKDFFDLYKNYNKLLYHPEIIRIIQKKNRSMGDYSNCLSQLSRLLNKSNASRIRFKEYFKRERLFKHGSEKLNLFKTISDVNKYRNEDSSHGEIESCEKEETQKLLENLSSVCRFLHENNNYPTILRIKNYIRNEYGIYSYKAYDIDNDNEYTIVTSQNLDSTRRYYIFYDSLSNKIIYPTLIDMKIIDDM